MSHRRIAAATVAALVWGSASIASTPSLNSVSYPEGQNVKLVFDKTSAAPEKASMSGSVKYAGGQAKISLSYSKMEPAVLFGGDIAAYVVWAVAKSAGPENLGELLVSKSGGSGSQTFTTGKKDFAIMVTAEPYYLVGRPFDLVIFTSGPKDAAKTPAAAFQFDDFRAGPIVGVPSISGMKYEDKTPVPIKQADTALKLAERLKADEANPTAVKRATEALGEAKNAKGSTAISDAAHRSISSSAEALRDWGRARDQAAAAKAAAAAAAEKAALEKNVATTQEKLSTTEAERAALAKERDALNHDRAQLTAERDALAAKLQGALGQVADTKSTARGTVTSLSGVLFDTGKATLKPEAKITLAKLAGVMLVFSKTSMAVEGYTDNTGTDATNLKLSEARAKEVRDFLEAQGIASSRLSSVGKGPADPVAPNDTPEGRSKNRRVEIVSSEPQL